MTIPTYSLNDGLSIPSVGFGTYLLKGESGVESITTAIDAGYRLLDSAYNYENEGTVGEALRRSSVAREDIWVTSKLPGRHHRYQDALQTVEESLFRANLAHYDLYLIHWPNPLENLYVEAWQALIEARKRGLIRSIGVCNFLPEHVQRLKRETGVLPSINQIEMHPYFNQSQQIAWNQEHSIVVEAWSPLGRGSDMLQNSTIAAIAARHGKTASQTILRWQVQQNVIPIPKAASRVHQQENLALFDFVLQQDEMDAINALTRPDGRTTNQDPAVHQEF